MAIVPDKELHSSCRVFEMNEKISLLRCQPNVSSLNVEFLSDNINKISKEVEDAMLRKKWSSQLRVDVGTDHERIQSPVEDAVVICTELRTSPEDMEDVRAALKQRQSSLQDTIKALTKEISELNDT